MDVTVLKKGGGVPNEISPHCALVTLSSKSPTRARVVGGPEVLSISTDVETQQIKHVFDSPITSLIAIDNSPLVVLGTYEGCIKCIHIGRQLDANEDEMFSTSILIEEQVSNEAITKLCYQESTKKLAFATSDGCNQNRVTVVCLEPNNMKVIGKFQTPAVDALTWGQDDFKLYVAHENSISLYDIIGMTFEKEDPVECLWTRSTDITRFHQIAMADTGLIYAIDGRRRGIYTISILNADVSEEKLTTMYYEGDSDSSASYCLLLDGDLIITGSVSGETNVCDSSDKSKWETVSSHSCAVASLVATNSGFLSVAMDGAVIEHKKRAVTESIVAPSSTRWDYLLQTGEISRSTNAKYQGTQNMLYREDFTQTDKDARNFQSIVLESVRELKTNGLSKNKVSLYSSQSENNTGQLPKHLIETIHDIHDIELQLRDEFNQEDVNEQIVVCEKLGDAGLHDLTENDAFMLIDSENFVSKEMENAKLKEEIAMALASRHKLASELKELKWRQEHLQLKLHDALEETKDWQQLRVSSQLRQLVEGKAMNHEKAFTNSFDRLAIAEDIQKSQLAMYERETERLVCQIQSTEDENRLVESQIKDAKAKIAQDEKEYSSIAEVKKRKTNQKDKMQQLMRRRRLVDELQSQEKTIAQLRSQLKVLQARTFPHFED